MDEFYHWARNVMASNHISNDEEFAVTHTMIYGKKYGYGNLIAWLGTAWARELMEEGMEKDEALERVENYQPYSRLL